MTSLHRSKLISVFEKHENSIIFIKGASIAFRYNTDHEMAFRQESNFLYLTGIHEPDFSCMLDLATGEYLLFAPKRDTKYAVWNGYITPQETYKQRYEPDAIYFDTDIESILKKKNPNLVYCLDESQAQEIKKLGFSINSESLMPALTECRVNKTEWELVQMRIAGKVTSEAHIEVMRYAKPGLKEYQLKAVFEGVGAKYNCFQQAFSGIYGAGKNSAVLHYQERIDELKNGELVLVDAGLEYNGYAGDVTRTYPTNGKFTETQASIYQICLDAHTATIEAIKPGVLTEDLHFLAARTILSGLKDMSLVYGEVEELMEQNLFALFFPHGLGHFLGIDTHDVGGYKKGVEPIQRPGIQYLRTRRELEPGMVITIEPGLYFIPPLLLPAFENPKQQKFLNIPELTKLLNFGGIRIEDDIHVSETGYENLTDVPKSIADIENEMDN